MSEAMYVVTVTRVEKVEVLKQGEWGVVETRLYTEEEMQTMGGDPERFRGETKTIRGYPPDRVVTEDRVTNIYSQTLEQLDLAAVVAAINGLKKAEV